jgi:hypothetical protein
MRVTINVGRINWRLLKNVVLGAFFTGAAPVISAAWSELGSKPLTTKTISATATQAFGAGMALATPVAFGFFFPRDKKEAGQETTDEEIV